MDDIKVLDKYIDECAALYNGDTTELIKAFTDESVDMEMFSPPVFKPVYI